MEWFLLESLLALAVAVGIVWWTMRPAARRDRPAEKNAPDDDARDDGRQ